MSTAKVWNVVNALQNEPSTNNRLAILEYSRDDKDVLAFFKACLDDRKYGVKQIPEHSKNHCKDSAKMDSSCCCNAPDY